MRYRTFTARRLVAVALAFFAATAPAIAQSRRLTHEFPIEYSEEHAVRLVVPVTIGGVDYRFAIDTGATHTTFDARLQSLLGKRMRTTRFLTPGGARAQATYTAPQAFIERLPLSPLNKVTIDDVAARFQSGDSHRVDGILGMDALPKCVLHLDFDRGALSFHDAVPNNAGARVELVRGAPVPLFDAVLEGLGTRSFIIDTGFEGELAVPSADFAAVAAARQPATGATVPVFTPAGPRTSQWTVLNSRFSTGAYSHRNLVLFDVPSSDDALNLVGLDYLSRYIVTFDFQNSAIYLRPGATFSAFRPGAGLLGVRLARAGSDVVILSVRPRSRAAGFGLLANDVLKKINGEPTESMRDADIVRRLSGRGRKLFLEFLRVKDGAEPWMTIEDLPQRTPTPLNAEANRIAPISANTTDRSRGR